MKDGYVMNCVIDPNCRVDEWMFCQGEGDVSPSVRLNGYAIIPLEQYQELTGKDVSDLIDRANDEHERGYLPPA